MSRIDRPLGGGDCKIETKLRETGSNQRDRARQVRYLTTVDLRFGIRRIRKLPLRIS